MKKSRQDWHKSFIATAAALGIAFTNVGATRIEQPSNVQATDPAHPAPGANCAPINNVPQTPEFKVWNDFRASLKNAPTINGDLSRLGAANINVCMLDPSTPNPDANYDANALYNWLGTVVAYGFTTHQLLVDSALPMEFKPDQFPDGLKTLPQQIARTLPLALNDALMNIQYGGPSVTSFISLTTRHNSEMVPDAMVNQVRVDLAIDNIMLMRRFYDLAQSGYDYTYKQSEKVLPGFMSIFESKYVNAPAGQSPEDRMWSVLKTALQDKGQTMIELQNEQSFLKDYLLQLGPYTYDPPWDFTQTYDPSNDITRTNDSASYLQQHAQELKAMMLHFYAPPNDADIRGAIQNIQNLVAMIEHPAKRPKPAHAPHASTGTVKPLG